MRVLVIGNDHAALAAVEPWLKKEEYLFERVPFEDGILYASLVPFEIIIVLNNCHEENLGFLCELRAKEVPTPVLVVANSLTPVQRTQALDRGADGCLCRPLFRQEFAALIRAIVRRANRRASSTMEVGESVTLDLNSKNMKVRGYTVALKLSEYRVLELLALRRGSAISEDDFIEHVYGVNGKEVTGQRLAISICNIRRKIYQAGGKKNCVETVRGIGYRLA